MAKMSKGDRLQKIRNSSGSERQKQIKLATLEGIPLHDTVRWTEHTPRPVSRFEELRKIARGED